MSDGDEFPSSEGVECLSSEGVGVGSMVVVVERVSKKVVSYRRHEMLRDVGQSGTKFCIAMCCARGDM